MSAWVQQHAYLGQMVALNSKLSQGTKQVRWWMEGMNGWFDRWVLSTMTQRIMQGWLFPLLTLLNLLDWTNWPDSCWAEPDIKRLNTLVKHPTAWCHFLFWESRKVPSHTLDFFTKGNHHFATVVINKLFGVLKQRQRLQGLLLLPLYFCYKTDKCSEDFFKRIMLYYF